MGEFVVDKANDRNVRKRAVLKQSIDTRTQRQDGFEIVQALEASGAGFQTKMYSILPDRIPHHA